MNTHHFRTTFTTTILALLALLTSPAVAAVGEGVEEVFEAYRAAALARNGKAAADAVSKGTIIVYENCRKLAISAKESELEKLPQAEVIVILRMRYAVERETLEKMDGRACFVHAVDNGWVSDNALEKMRLGKVRVDGDKAYATVVNDGKDVPGLGFDFVQERGQWRFDVTGIITRAEPMFAQMRRSTNKNKVGLAMTFLERIYGEQMPKDILAGPLE